MRRKTASGHYIGQEFPELRKKMLLLTLLIRRINEDDVNLTPKEQAAAIKLLPGLPTYKMESLIPITGPTLADSIRKIISKGRATNRTTKRRSPRYRKKTAAVRKR